MSTHHHTRTMLAAGGAFLLLATAPMGAAAATPPEAPDAPAPVMQAPAVESPAVGSPVLGSPVQQMPTVPDTWSGAWKKTDGMMVVHPNFGPLEVRLYFQQTSAPGAAPTTGEVAYALYQEGRPVGFAASAPGTQSLPPSFQGTLGMAEEDLPAGGVRVDNHGNVYFFSHGLTVLTPTEHGYDSRGTLPNPTGEGLFANVSSVEFGAKGEPTITTRAPAPGGGTLTQAYHWQDGQFVAE